jgi:hypothetical protein
MTASGDILQLIDQLASVCKRYDPDFAHRVTSYAGSPFRLSLDGVPESELERVAEAFGRPVTKPLDLELGAGLPTIHASSFIPIGSLSIFLWSKRRPATRAEIEAALADINRRTAAPGAVPERALEASAPSLSPDGDQPT